MAKVHVTREAVFSACNQILAAKQLPSQSKVRKIIGADGSNSTLQKYLKEWNELHNDDLKKLKPEERGKIPEHFVPLITKAFHTMYDLIEEELASDRITQLERRNEELLEENERLTMDNQRIVVLEAKIEGLMQGFERREQQESKADKLIELLEKSKGGDLILKNLKAQLESA